MSLSFAYDLLMYILARIYEFIWCRDKPIPLKCLVGKTAIVTGGNAGIGLATATVLASRGCRVILADCQNGESSRDQIIASTDNKNIVYKHLDLSSLQSVRNFAANICKTEEKIDILINNAGIGLTKRLVSVDGLNYLMQVNIFGAFLLTHLLLEPMKKAKQAKVIFVSSVLANFHSLRAEKLNITDFEMDDEHQILLYSNSKACCILAAQEFGKKLEKYGITANSIDPVGVRTQIFKPLGDYNNWLMKSFLMVGLQLAAQDVLDVANCFLNVAIRNEPATNGKNYVLSHIGRKPTILMDRKLCQDLWSKMEDLVELKPEEKIVS
ncbi:dehydrogenase/reductase SDR family member 13-like [Coccinella septempunctata]|uniref:dehydrogenase/reductase SDR family member 13-like n=1 Tax=Coccinella septempunctata TaxID=41139 RepID=UPI001D07D77C|nr:dehydrogenase/reductase SDR family member 13-like [Coccinella septempunctata]XP_044755464.1 dehydrogenase/reductase SDR family member 13-like [Coccinella septempunctata]